MVWLGVTPIKNKSWTILFFFPSDNKTICTHMHGNGRKPTECAWFAASHDFGRNDFVLFVHSIARCVIAADVLVLTASSRIGAQTAGFPLKHTTHTFASVCSPFPLTSFATHSRSACGTIHQHIHRRRERNTIISVYRVASLMGIRFSAAATACLCWRCVRCE